MGKSLQKNTRQYDMKVNKLLKCNLYNKSETDVSGNKTKTNMADINQKYSGKNKEKVQKKKKSSAGLQKHGKTL